MIRFVSLRGEADPATIRRGLELLSLGREERVAAGVAFRTGSLAFQAQDWRSAKQAYGAGLRLPMIGGAQKGAFLLMLGQVSEREGDSKAALRFFERASVYSAALSGSERRVLFDWRNYLRLRAGDRATVDARIQGIFQAVRAGLTYRRLPEDVAFVYTARPELAVPLTSLIFERAAKGRHESDLRLLAMAFSNDLRFSESGPVVPSGFVLADALSQRLLLSPLTERCLLASLSWMQALEGSGARFADRKAALEFGARVVKRICESTLSTDERAVAVSIVHGLQSLASRKDAKAQTLIDRALRHLEAKSIVESRTTTSSEPPVVAVILIVGTITIGAILLLMRRSRKAV